MAVWIVFSTFCSCTGWVLSALHQLNAAGYAAALVAGLATVWVFRHKLFPQGVRFWNLRKARRRVRRTFPLAFLVLAGLAFLGGAIHPPSNYDAMAYRIPRVLHWLAAGQWHWIYTGFGQVNTRACGMEWLSASLIAFTKTDRWLFVINAASYLLLPGLVFSVFRQIGVKPRAAWYWMWLLPTGYCYLLQAGSVSNDLFSTVYALAAVCFALRAQKSARVSDVCLSLLSAALLTGAKATNLPLLLPWVVAFAPTWRVWLARPLALAAIMPPVLAASLLPTLLLNAINCGDWTGAAAEHVTFGGAPMWLCLLANCIIGTLANLAPPICPFASAWNRVVDAATPASLAALFRTHFVGGAGITHLSELQVEEGAGAGFGITILLGVSLLAVVIGSKRRAAPRSGTSGTLVPRLLCLAPWVSLLYLMAKLNFGSGPRYFAAYYPLLIMGLLRSPAQAELVRRKWWRSWALFSCGLAGLLLVISPARPLWPAAWFFQHCGSWLQSNKLVARAMDSYATKSARADVFAPVIALLPPDATVIGFAAGDFPEPSLWRPFGSRRVLHIRLSDSGDAMRRRGIKYVVLTTDRLEEPWGEWLKQRDARELQAVTLKMWGHLPPFVWRLVELNPHTGQSGPKPSTKPKHEL